MRSVCIVICAGALVACAPVPQDREVLRDEALAARLSGKELRVRAPEALEESELVLVARLKPDRVAEMAAERSGAPVRAFRDTERWQVRGQALCIHDGPAPNNDDCIQVDWIAGNQLQLTETKPDGSRESTRATLAPL